MFDGIKRMRGDDRVSRNSGGLRMTRLAVVVSQLILAALVMAACGNSDGGDDSSVASAGQGTDAGNLHGALVRVYEDLAEVSAGTENVLVGRAVDQRIIKTPQGFPEGTVTTIHVTDVVRTTTAIKAGDKFDLYQTGTSEMSGEMIPFLARKGETYLMYLTTRFGAKPWNDETNPFYVRGVSAIFAATDSGSFVPQKERHGVKTLPDEIGKDLLASERR